MQTLSSKMQYETASIKTNQCSASSSCIVNIERTSAVMLSPTSVRCPQAPNSSSRFLWMNPIAIPFMLCFIRVSSTSLLNRGLKTGWKGSACRTTWCALCAFTTPNSTRAAPLERITRLKYRIDEDRVKISVKTKISQYRIGCTWEISLNAVAKYMLGSEDPSKYLSHN